MCESENKKLPFPFPQLYPELHQVGCRKQQLEALLESNLVILVLFGLLLLLMPRFLPDICEHAVKTWLGLGGPTADVAAAASFILIMLVVLYVLLSIGTNRARKSIRRRLALSGQLICIECGYDLRSQTEPRCPECGTPFTLFQQSPNSDNDGEPSSA